MTFSIDTYATQGYQSYVLFEEDERDEGSRPTYTGYEFEETRDGRWLVARGWCLHTDSCRFEPFGYMPMVEGESDSDLYERADAFFNDSYECDEPYPFTEERGYARIR